MMDGDDRLLSPRDPITSPAFARALPYRRLLVGLVLLAVHVYLVVASILVSPWLLCIVAFSLIVSFAALANRLPYERRRRQLQSKFPAAVAINVQADFGLRESLLIVMTIYGSPTWDRRANIAPQILAMEDGLSFWTVLSGDNPIARVPWSALTELMLVPSLRAGQMAIAVSAEGVPTFGLALMSPRTYGLALATRKGMQAAVDRINQIRSNEIRKGN